MAKRTISQMIGASKRARTTGARKSTRGLVKKSKWSGSKKNSKQLVTKGYLQRVLKSETELKHAVNLLTLTWYNSGINSSADMWQVLPGISPGTGNGHRIGDKINPTSLVINGYMKLATAEINGGDVAARRILARLFCYAPKFRKSYDDGVGGLTQILDNNGPAIFTGANYDVVMPKNFEEFVFYEDKVVNLCKGSGVSDSTGASAASNPNPDSIYFFKIVIKPPKELVYTDVTTNPTNWAPILAAGYTNVNAGPDTTLTKLGITATATLYYRDA